MSVQWKTRWRKLAVLAVSVLGLIAAAVFLQGGGRQGRPLMPSEGGQLEVMPIADSVAADSVAGVDSRAAGARDLQAEWVAGDNASAIIKIVVIDESRARADANVLLVDATGEEEQLLCEWDSTTVLPVQLEFPVRLEARGERGTATIILDAFPPRDVTVMLRRGFAVNGVVVMPNGTNAKEGVQVVAESVGGAATGQVFAQTDRDGVFVLEGLNPSGTYGLYAAGRGVISYGPVTQVRFGQLEEELVVVQARYLFGALIDASGALEEGCDCRRQSRDGASFGVMDRRFERIGSAHPGVRHLWPNCADMREQGIFPMFYAGLDPELSVDGYFRLTVAGQSVVGAACQLQKVEEELPVVKVQGQPDVDIGGGVINFSVLAPLGWQPLDPSARVGKLRLTEPSGERLIDVTLTEADLVTGFKVDCLPLGVYYWRFELAEGLVSWPLADGEGSLPAVVVSADPAWVNVDLSKLGSVTVSTISSDWGFGGYRGALALGEGRARPRLFMGGLIQQSAYNSVRTYNGTASIVGLPSGAYWVAPFSESGIDWKFAEEFRVEAESEAVQVRLDMR